MIMYLTVADCPLKSSIIPSKIKLTASKTERTLQDSSLLIQMPPLKYFCLIYLRYMDLKENFIFSHWVAIVMW